MPSGGAAMGPARRAALDLLDRTFRSKPLVFVTVAWMAGIGLADYWRLAPAMARGLGLALAGAGRPGHRLWHPRSAHWTPQPGRVLRRLIVGREGHLRIVARSSGSRAADSLGGLELAPVRRRTAPSDRGG